MSISVPSALSVFSWTGAAVELLAGWAKKARGDRRALLLELHDNLALLDLVADGTATLDGVVDQLSAEQFERLNREGYDFNRLQRRPIRRMRSLESTDLVYWQGNVQEMQESTDPVIKQFLAGKDNEGEDWLD